MELTTDFIAVQQKKIGKDNPHFQHGFLPCLSKLRAAGDAGKTMASRIGGYKMSHKKTKKNPRAHRPAETQEHGRKLLAEDSIGWGLSSEETYDILDPNRRKIKPEATGTRSPAKGAGGTSQCCDNPSGVAKTPSAMPHGS